MQATQDQGTASTSQCLVISLNCVSVQRHGLHARTATSADVSVALRTKINISPTILVVCRYPDVFKHARRDYIESAVSSPRQVVKLSDTPTIYSSEDMQLFHHYLVSAHPWIPHDWEELWVTDVPAACHKVSATSRSPCKRPNITDHAVPISHGCYAGSCWISSCRSS